MFFSLPLGTDLLHKINKIDVKIFILELKCDSIDIVQDN